MEEFENNEINRKSTTKKKKKKSKLKIFFKILIILLVIVLILAIGAGCGVLYIYKKLDKIDYKENELQKVEVNEGVENTGFMNIVLFGVDSRDNKYEEHAGGDTILIVSINNETKEVKLASVYRDSYLSVDGKNYSKITDYFRQNGAEKTVGLLNKNLDLDISEYVTINFAVVVDVINAVGGIEMTITKADLKYINDYIEEIRDVTGIHSKLLTKTGTYTLDGAQALAYARIRYIGTDIDRTNRQRMVLSKAFEKIKTMNVLQLNSLVDKVLPKVQTTLSPNEVIKLATGVTKYNIADSIGFPYEWADYQPAKVYYLAPKNLEKNVTQLHKDLFGEEDYEVSAELKKISDNLIKKTGLK